MKIKTNELTGAALDWVVGKLELVDFYFNEFDGICRYTLTDNLYSPSTNWAQGGPIIEREHLELSYLPSMGEQDRWKALHTPDDQDPYFYYKAYGDTPLIAAMRCFCCAKLGEFVDIPEELCQQQKN